MENLEKILLSIKLELDEMKKNFSNSFKRITVSENWIPIDEIQEWIKYGNTQLCEFLKTPGLVVAQIGRRKFVHRKSLEQVLERNIIKGL